MKPPKPNIKPNRLPKAPKRMTLVAGFFCRDGLLMCADMEEVGVGVSKRKINKLFFRPFGEGSIVITGAGSSAVIENAIERMHGDLLKPLGVADENGLQDLVDSTLLTVYERYVWPNQRNDHSVNLLVGYSQNGQQRFWITHDTVTTPETRFACAGTGEDLANYFADRLYHPQYSEQQMVTLAAFIFREVKENVTGVGQGTQMWILRKAGPPKFYDSHEFEVLERGLPRLESTLYRFSKELTGPSIFPLLPFTLDLPYVEMCRQEDGYFTGPGFRSPREIKKLTFK